MTIETTNNMEEFYKLATPDGWDFYTRNTINYRTNVGKIVKPRTSGVVKLCSDTCLHASRNPNQAFIGASIPCSVYQVKGIPIVEGKNKVGFSQLHVIKKLDPVKVFKWRYTEACNPINPFKIPPPEITEKHIELLKKWDSVWDSVWDSIRASVWDSIGASVWDSVWDSVGDSVWDSVGDSVEASIGASVRDSVNVYIEVYIGYLFQPCVSKWEKNYPYQVALDLWKCGLIPSFDGNIWRLHGGKDAKILWEGKI